MNLFQGGKNIYKKFWTIILTVIFFLLNFSTKIYRVTKKYDNGTPQNPPKIVKGYFFCIFFSSNNFKYIALI